MSQLHAQKKINLNRKLTKIEFLSLENSQLIEQISELQEIIKCNKDALNIALQQQYQQNTSIAQDRLDSCEQGTSTQKHFNTEEPVPKNSGQILIIQALQQENMKLINLTQKLSEEKNYASGKALIMEQMFEAADREKREIIQELKDQTEYMLKRLQENEAQLQAYERTNPNYDEITNIVIKYREVINLNEVSVRLHEEIEKFNIIILKQAKQIQNLKQLNEELIKINMQVNQEMIVLKSAVASSQTKLAYTFQKSTSNLNQEQVESSRQKIAKSHMHLATIQSVVEDENAKQNYNKKPTINNTKDFFKMHQKFLNEQDRESEIDKEMMSPCLSPLPDKVQVSNLSILSIQKELKIPKLDLQKALQIQDINAKKSTLQQQQKFGGDVYYWIDKFKRNDKLLEESRKNLAREILINKTFELENEYQKRMLTELEGRNEILVNSHKQYEERWQKIFHSYQFYFEFYKLYQNQSLLKTYTLKSEKQLEGINNFMNSIRQSETIVDHDRIISKMSRQDKKQLNQMINRSIFDLNEEDLYNQQSLNQQYSVNRLTESQQFSKENAKIYLKDIAKDLYLQLYQQQNNNQLTNNNQNTNNNPQQKVEKKIKLKRSLSNPLDYIAYQKTQNIYDNIQLNNQEQTKQHNKSYIENIDQIDQSQLEMINQQNENFLKQLEISQQDHEPHLEERNDTENQDQSNQNIRYESQDACQVINFDDSKIIKDYYYEQNISEMGSVQNEMVTQKDFSLHIQNKDLQFSSNQDISPINPPKNNNKIIQLDESQINVINIIPSSKK